MHWTTVQPKVDELVDDKFRIHSLEAEFTVLTLFYKLSIGPYFVKFSRSNPFFTIVVLGG